MLIVLVSLFASLILAPCLAYNYDRESLVGWAIVPNIIVAVFLIALWSVSYSNYIDMKQRLVNFDIHADTIASYEKLAKLDTTKPGIINPLTDLKYQNYQKGIKDLVKDLRNSCIIYNQTVVGKRTFGNNIIFNWLIVMPDDNMEIVKFSDFLNVMNRS
jgi:hypothetical protein